MAVAVRDRSLVLAPGVRATADEDNFGIVAEMFKMPFSSALPWMVATMPAESVLMTIVTPSLGFQLLPLKTIVSPGM